MDTLTSSHTRSVPASDSAHTSAPRLPEWARILLTVLSLFVAYVPIVLLTSLPAVSEWLKSEDYWVNTVANLSVQFSVALMMLLLAISLAVIVDRRSANVLGLRINLRGVMSLFLGTGLAVAIIWATDFILHALGVVDIVPQGSGAPTGAPIALIMALAIGRAFLLQGFGEEVLFRGYLMQSLSEHPHRALWVSASVFAILHLVSQGPQQNPLDRLLYLILPFGFAVLAGYLAILLRSTWAAVGIHGGMHIGTTTLDWFGFDTYTMLCAIVEGLVFLAVGLMVARFIPHTRWDEIATHGLYAPAPRR